MVIPVYNEMETIQEILRRVAAVQIDKEIVIVDDCSTDGTRDVLRQDGNSLGLASSETPGRDAGSWRLATCEFFIRIEIRAKARLCGAVLRKRAAK